jgi:hypothetical protein
MTTFTIACPCGCGETLTARDAGFTATSVEVDACSKRAGEGIASFNMRKSAAYAAANPR